MEAEAIKYFGTVTNFVISVSVTLYGYTAWFRRRNVGHANRFSPLAYRCWWASWLCWVFAWGVLLLAALMGLDPVPVGMKILTLTFDNLNSVLMVLVYFVITRGNRFDRQRVKTAFLQISGSLLLGCLILYMLAQVIGIAFAYEVHRTWSLCLGVFSPMLIGWACYLRYNTLLVLVVGIAYGFMQPLIYATELAAVQSSLGAQSMELYKPIFAMTLGGLKVLWAILFTQVLAHGATSGEPLILNETSVHFHFFRKWEKKVLGHALVLGVTYCTLLIAMGVIYVKLSTSFLTNLATSLSLVGGFMALLDWFWKLWDKGTQNCVGVLSKGGAAKLSANGKQHAPAPFITSEVVCRPELPEASARSRADFDGR